MKLSKFAALVKREGRCRVIRQGDHTWLSLGDTEDVKKWQQEELKKGIEND